MIANREWKEGLQIGKSWGEWEGIVVKSYYKIIGQKDISLLMRDIPGCWQIDAIAENEVGIYKATFYWHPEYGFVQWEYTKPNGEQVILELGKVSEFKD